MLFLRVNKNVLMKKQVFTCPILRLKPCHVCCTCGRPTLVPTSGPCKDLSAHEDSRTDGVLDSHQKKIKETGILNTIEFETQEDTWRTSVQAP